MTNSNDVSLTEIIDIWIIKIAEKNNDIVCWSHLKTHEYNEVKDIGQTLLDKIAEVDGVTTTHVYQRFSLTLDDW